MKLGLLALEAGFSVPDSLQDARVSRVTDDSRKAAPEVLFFATREGERFAADALAAGAFAAGGSEAGSFPCSSPAESMGIAAACLHGHPSRDLFVTGVTGTNGKTSTAWMIYHLWKAAGIPAGMIGTLGLRYAVNGNEQEEKTGYTTPRSPELQEMFARMRDAGVRRVVMEVSSEALALGRLSGTHFRTAVFTNLTRDHLDYHGTMEQYFAAKARLLSMTAAEGGRLVCYSGADAGLDPDLRMSEFALKLAETSNAEVTIVPEAEDLGRIAHFQNINATLALLAAALDQSEEAQFRSLLPSLPEVPGRFESVDLSSIATTGSIAVVDYAHSPDALQTLLRETRARFGHVCTVFGCGGNRDPGKRPLMGQIAAELSDQVIVTDDNPRREDPAAIRAAILTGILSEHRGRALEIGDRRAAIERALFWAKSQPGAAAVVVAGKGHEQGQIFADRTENFSDLAEVKSALSKLEEQS